MKYFAPLSSYKPKHEKMKNGLDFIKVGNYAVININNMFRFQRDVILMWILAGNEIGNIKNY